MKLSEAKAVVTGGASGLGFATAPRVIDAGGQVVLLDINDDLGGESASQLGERASYVNTDVSNEESVQAAVQQAKETMGGITLAVNCAGVANAGRALGREGPWPCANFNRVIQINLIGTFNVTKEAAAIMNENDPTEDGERGVIVSTASIAAFEGQIGQAAYAASKGGVHAMMLPLAREFAAFGIRVNTIAPGIMLTPMMAGMTQEVHWQRRFRSHGASANPRNTRTLCSTSTKRRTSTARRSAVMAPSGCKPSKLRCQSP